MKTPAIIFFILFIACNAWEEADTNKDTTKTGTPVRDTVYINPNDQRDWQEGFGLTHNPDVDSIWFKPVSHYLNNKECSGLARDFYYGSLRPSDDGTTDELLKLACTDNAALRPFYRWCLNKTIVVSDGALGEHTGIPARRYAEKFPEEFFHYMDIDSTGGKYDDWVGAIEYSGFYDTDDWRKPKDIIIRMTATMKQNCSGCDERLLRRIEKFAKDCFD